MAKIILSFHGLPCSFPGQDVGAGRGQSVSKGLESKAKAAGPAVEQHSSR